MGSEKLQAFRDLLVTFDRKDKIVVCARFVHELHILKQTVEETGRTAKLIGGGEKYNNQFDTDALILQIQSGISINLSQARDFVFYSWDHSLINYEQARFRVLSFNTDQVHYYYLIAQDTVDEDIYDAVQDKKDFADLIIDRYRKR